MDAETWACRPGARAWTAPRVTSAAKAFHASLPNCPPTPLIRVPALAERLGVAECWVKDESQRMGLLAFKVLGASWAVNVAVRSTAGLPPAESLSQLQDTAAVAGAALTLVAATDGNHGRAVARMAQLLGLRARIYVPTVISATAVEAIVAENAEVVPTGLTYDAAVMVAANSCRAGPDQVLVQDTSWPGYQEIPRQIVNGYATLFAEIDDQVSAPLNLVVVPTGVGSLLQAALLHYRAPERRDRPAVLAVEPLTAACVTRSLAAGEPVNIDTSSPTIMAGLNCGSVSEIAWPVIREGLDAGVAVSDSDATAAAAVLQRHGVDAGPCGAAALAGAEAALGDAERRTDLGIDHSATVVLINTEGPAANPLPDGEAAT